MTEKAQATESGLDPWPVIRGFLLQRSSYEVPAIVYRAGLPTVWNLSETQNYSHQTRLSAYRPRIDDAYRALSTDAKMRVAFIIVKELVAKGQGDELNEALHEVGWEIRDTKLVPSGTPATQLFFPEQSQHNAYVEIRQILQKATESVDIIDPYVDQTILTLLSTCAGPGMAIRILSSKFPTDLLLESKKWQQQYQRVTLEFRKTSDFHDRFIVTDRVNCWHIGCSIKDAGNRAFMLAQVRDEIPRAALIDAITSAWSAAKST